MSLLHQIQEALLQSDSDIGSILLKLRLLAAKLESDVLADWIKYESEGYPQGVKVPDYRVVNISYKGTFSGPFQSGIRNAPIPSVIIEEIGGDVWTNFEVRESITAIDALIKSNSHGHNLRIDASNLILLLQGKVYPNFICNELHGIVASSSLNGIQQVVKGRILELTLEIEKSIPSAFKIKFDGDRVESSKETQQIVYQIIYGNVNTAIAGGHGLTNSITVRAGDKKSLIEYLVESGLPQDMAEEFAKILQSESPKSQEEPFGEKANKWIVSNLKKAADGAWNIGISVAVPVLTEAALRFYNLK